MPFKDQAERNENQKRWRRERHTEAYMKWLYQKRSLSKRIEKLYEHALYSIETGNIVAHPSEVAEKALLDAQGLRRQTGNRFNHDTQTPYWKE